MNKCITILHKNEYIETEYIYFEGEISCHLSLQDNFSVLKINDHEIILSPHISHTKLIEIFNKIIDSLILILWVFNVIRASYLYLKGKDISNYQLLVIIILSFEIYNKF